MNKEDLIRNLEHTEKKHRNDTVNTFDTDISMMCSDVLKVLKNCIEIPDNATNWDMVKTMFPNAIKSDYVESSLDVEDYVEIYLGDYIMRVSHDWLIAPYESEREKSMTRPINESEQWKLDGECQKCSRLNYCNKPCTISKRRTDAEIKQVIVREMFKRFRSEYE